MELLKEKKSVIVLNKMDLISCDLKNKKEIKETNRPIVEMAVKEEKGLDNLYKELIDMFNLNQINLDNELIITNIRHQNLINKAIESTRMALNDLKMSMPIDIISINIKQILEHLGEITGDNVSEDIIKNIFLNFA